MVRVIFEPERGQRRVRDLRATFEAMRLDRARWISRVVREPFSEAEENASALFWDRLSPSERVRLTWELSKELHLLVERNAGRPTSEVELERRLPRAALRIERR
jgi:hypothetical protein